VPEEVKAERWHRFMAAQQEVSRALMAARVGRVIEVIVDKVDAEGAVGRSKWDAPEIDGSVFLNGAVGLKCGDIVRARVIEADEYDVRAELDRAPSQRARIPSPRLRGEG
jgi:ribosomal protein S12 methylthiotransferase